MSADAEEGDDPDPNDPEGDGPAATQETDLSSLYDVNNLDNDVFQGIYSHDGAKAVVGAALRQGDVHVLFEGPPGSGKSAFLLALESNVPGVIYRDGDQITGAKLREVLKDDPPILLIDEIDALDNKAYDVLSTPLEHGRLVRDSARESYDVEVGTQVIAACNDRTELPEHIANRFRPLEFEAYGEDEYVDLCGTMLVTEVDWVSNETEAREAAKKVANITGRHDPRDARDVARMSENLDEIDMLAKAMHDPDADVEAQPLFPGEIARAQGEVGKVHLRRILSDEMTEAADDPDESGGSSEGGGDGDEAVEEEIEAAVEEAIT